jgi:hypothetical protein
MLVRSSVIAVGMSRRRRAGSDQRPTDEVLGGGNKALEDDTAGDDHGKRNPDDTEGHMPFRRLDTEAVDEDEAADDTEGHFGRYGG